MRAPVWIVLTLCLSALVGCPAPAPSRPVPPQPVSPPAVPPPTEAAQSQQVDAASSPCLPVRTADLSDLLMALPLAPAGGQPAMVSVSRGAPRWMAGFNAALAWVNEDCPAFQTFAAQMDYDATEVIDRKTGHHHWVLTDGAARWNGVFVFRAPSERAAARPLVIAAPHFGSDFTDDRAVRLYRDVGAAVLLQNSAHRCNLSTCSGCSGFVPPACGGCPRASDDAHSVDQLYFAVYAGLAATRRDLHFELHGAGSHARLMGCTGAAHLSQGSTRRLEPQVDEGSYPSRFWHALEARLGPNCVCYHQRESGCLLAGTSSVLGRLINQEPQEPFDPCAQPATRLSGRFLHFEWVNVPIEPVIAALTEAVQLP